MLRTRSWPLLAVFVVGACTPKQEPVVDEVKMPTASCYRVSMMQWNPRIEAQSAGYLTPPAVFQLDSTETQSGWRRVVPPLSTLPGSRAEWQQRGDSLLVVWTVPAQRLDLHLVRDYDGWMGMVWTRNDSSDVAPESPINLRGASCDSLGPAAPVP